MKFFSPSANDGRGAFYSAEIHGASMPSDAIKLTGRLYREMMEGQAQGRTIVPGPDGLPRLAPIARPSLDQLRARAVRAVKAEARRRILAIASLERQANDNASIAMTAMYLAERATNALEPGVYQAIKRRAAIDAIRAASNAIEATIARMPAANLTAFDATADRLWRVQE